MEIHWQWQSFKQLNTEELYSLLALRQEVFIIEQNCLYLDVDGKDKNSFHLMGYLKNELVAYARIIEPNIHYKEVSTGRILNAKNIRGLGVGIQLMAQAISRINHHYGAIDIRISAQSHLENFYQKFGFVSTGKEYMEDNIPHMEMLRPHARFQDDVFSAKG